MENIYTKIIRLWVNERYVTRAKVVDGRYGVDDLHRWRAAEEELARLSDQLGAEYVCAIVDRHEAEWKAPRHERSWLTNARGG